MSNNGTIVTEKKEPVISSKWPQIIIQMPESKQDEAPEQIPEKKEFSFAAALLWAAFLIAAAWYVTVGWEILQ